MKKRAFFGSYSFASSYRFPRAAGTVFAVVVCLLGASAGLAFAEEQPSGSGTPSGFEDIPVSSVTISDEELKGEMDEYLLRKASTIEYLAWKAKVNEYLAWKADVNEYLAWKADVNEYLAWKAKVNEYLAWKENVNKYLERKARVKEHSFWQRRRDQANENSEQKYYISKSAAVTESNTIFLRGDVNQDGKLSVQDAKVLLDLVYNSSYEPACLESADVNNDGKVRLGDALQLLNHVMRGMAPPAKPFPSCGLDSDAEGSGKDLGCGSYAACGAEEEKEKSYTWSEISKAIEEQEEASEEAEAEEDEAEEDDQ